MTKKQITKNAEEIKRASYDLSLLTRCLKEISELCHREDIEGKDIRNLTSLVKKNQEELSATFLRNSISIEFQLENKIIPFKP
jgi:hypothetical protein